MFGYKTYQLAGGVITYRQTDIANLIGAFS